MFIDENKSTSLALFLNGYDVVIMDTCSLMEDSFPSFADALVNAKDYFNKKKQIIIYKKCLDELNKHAANVDNDVSRIAAKRALKILKAVRRKKLFDCKKSKNDNFADNVIYANVSILRIHNRVLIITQDKKLTDDLNKLNNLDSQMGRKLSVYRIGKDGRLEVNRGVNFNSHFESKSSREQFNRLPKVQKFIQKPTESPRPAPANVVKKEEAAPKELVEAPVKEVKSAPKEVKPIEAKPVVKKEEAKKENNLPNGPRPYSYEDKNIASCLSGVASKAGVIFRDPSIAYFALAHGPLDLTSADRDKIAHQLEADVAKGRAMFQSDFYLFTAEKSSRGYRVSLTILDQKPISSPKVVKASPKKEVTPKKKAVKKEEPAKVTPKEKVTEVKPVPKKKPAPKKKEAPKVETPVEKEAAKDKKVAPKASPAKKVSPITKAATPKKAAAKAVVAPKAKETSPKASPKKETVLEKALKAEIRLNSVLSNKTYPNESKAKDIQTQLALIAKLKKEDRTKLKLSKEKLEAFLKDIA